MDSHRYNFPIGGPDGLDCHRCGRKAPTVETTHLNHGLCRACLEEALSLLPDERSPSLRAYLALAEARRQLQALVDGGELGWREHIDGTLPEVFGALYDGMTLEECEIAEKGEVQR